MKTTGGEGVAQAVKLRASAVSVSTDAGLLGCIGLRCLSCVRCPFLFDGSGALLCRGQGHGCGFPVLEECVLGHVEPPCLHADRDG